eukprot:1215703-Pleurochrysis_carterae.AAC.1
MVDAGEVDEMQGIVFRTIRGCVDLTDDSLADESKEDGNAVQQDVKDWESVLLSLAIPHESSASDEGSIGSKSIIDDTAKKGGGGGGDGGGGGGKPDPDPGVAGGSSGGNSEHDPFGGGGANGGGGNGGKSDSGNGGADGAGYSGGDDEPDAFGGGSGGGSGDYREEPTPSLPLPFWKQGMRFKMSFAGVGGTPLWFGALIGPPVDDSTFHCGFDDGEHRPLTLTEALQNAELGMIAEMDAGCGGLVQNTLTEFEMRDFTSLNYGAQKPQKVVGVLLGRPSDTIAGVPFFAEHHASQHA